jgi:hypothetical protein
MLPTLFLGWVVVSACQQKASQPEVDMQVLRQAIMKKTEQIYWIHLKLDSASTAVSEAELKMSNSECSNAGYLVADAYRNLQQADEALLELGRDLQELLNLDIEMGGRD